MDELIRKQDALDAIHCDITVTGRQNAELVAATIGAFADMIKALPPVQPEHGKWKPRYYDVGADVYVEWACSECGYVREKGREDGNAGEEPEADFCEKCGANMRGETE